MNAYMKFFNNLFGGRNTGFFGRRREPAVTPRRGGMALGTLAAIAAPFLIKRWRANRAQNAQPSAY